MLSNNLQACEDYREENFESATCNPNTEDGYYWRVGRKISGPGLFGFDSSERYPHCNETFVGEVAQSYALEGDLFYYDAASAYCASTSPDYCGDCCPTPTPGPITNCNDGSCGLFEVVCTEMPQPVIPTISPTTQDQHPSALFSVNTNQNVEFTLRIAVYIFLGLLVLVFVVALRCFTAPPATGESQSNKGKGNDERAAGES